MTGPKTRPQLQAPDLSPAAATDSPRPARTDPDDPRFAGAEQFETHDAYVRGVQNGRVRVVNPETVPPVPVPSATAEVVRRRSPEVSLSTKAPEYVMQQLRHRYAETGVTIRNQILLALKKDGLEIDDDDLQDERKRPRR
jgi:hypothetical protein